MFKFSYLYLFIYSNTWSYNPANCHFSVTSWLPEKQLKYISVEIYQGLSPSRAISQASLLTHHQPSNSIWHNMITCSVSPKASSSVIDDEYCREWVWLARVYPQMHGRTEPSAFRANKVSPAINVFQRMFSFHSSLASVTFSTRPGRPRVRPKLLFQFRRNRKLVPKVTG